MIYTASGAPLECAIDRYKTGDYGEALCTERVLCSECGAEILPGSAYFLIGQSAYCLDCKECAQSEILSRVCDDYLYVL